MTHHKRDASLFNFGLGSSGSSEQPFHNNNDSTNSSLTNDNTTRTSRCYSARTRTIRRSANPIYNQEFRFEVADDTLLQDEPLLFHVWDLSSSSGGNGKQQSIGLVYLDLNPLLMRTAIDEVGEDTGAGGAGGGEERSSTVELFDANNNSSGGGTGAGGGEALAAAADRLPGVIDGWFPLYDTLGGVRCELGLSIKLNFIGGCQPLS